MMKISFQVSPETSIVLPFFTGHLLQGVLLKNISKLDFQLAKELHEPNKTRWYAIEPLDIINGKKINEKGLWKVSPSDLYRFSFSFFGPSSQENKLIELLNIIHNDLHIGLTRFIVKSTSITRETYKSIIEKGIQLENKLILSFRTPVQFKSKLTSKPYLFPTPEYIFSNLGRLWNAFSEIKVDLDELISWVKTHIFIRAYKLKTQEINIGKTALQVGFRGFILLIIEEGEYCEWAKTLLKFSEYSNIGNKRSIGMGVVKVIETKRTEAKKTKMLTNAFVSASATS